MHWRNEVSTPVRAKTRDGTDRPQCSPRRAPNWPQRNASTRAHRHTSLLAHLCQRKAALARAPSASGVASTVAGAAVDDSAMVVMTPTRQRSEVPSSARTASDAAPARKCVAAPAAGVGTTTTSRYAASSCSALPPAIAARATTRPLAGTAPRSEPDINRISDTRAQTLRRAHRSRRRRRARATSLRRHRRRRRQSARRRPARRPSSPAGTTSR